MTKTTFSGWVSVSGILGGGANWVQGPWLFGTREAPRRAEGHLDGQEKTPGRAEGFLDVPPYLPGRANNPLHGQVFEPTGKNGSTNPIY